MSSALLLCLVVAVADGDTLTARCGEPGAYEQVRVRIAEIDAPERGQPFGQASRQALADLCFQQTAAIRAQKRDRYGRTVARVECRGQDVSRQLVADGHAWAFTRYLTDQRVADLEQQARSARRGLWVDPAPMAPWEWRAARRSAITPS